MAEYIEREALLKEMLDFHSIPVYIGHVTDEDIMFENMVDFVKEQPTADVVPVVRCCECKHRYIPERCALWYGHYDGKDYYVDRGDNFYCSYGERK